MFYIWFVAPAAAALKVCAGLRPTWPLVSNGHRYTKKSI